MSLRPIVRALVVPVLGLSLSPTATHPTDTEGQPAPPLRPVLNVNLAELPGLCLLPGIGPKLAYEIIQIRHELGPFRRPEDLMQCKGIGERLFSTLRPYVTVSGPSTLVSKVASR